MDIARIKDILSRHQSTRKLYDDGAIWVGYLGSDLTIIGVDPDNLFVALSALTENGPLCTQFEVRVGEWRAIITDPPTHVSVSAGRVEGGSITGLVINNPVSNQGVQGIFNTPIHFGKK